MQKRTCLLLPRFAPDKLIEVSFPCGVKVNLGNKVTPTQGQDKPSVKWDADSRKFYTLIMIDLDAPSCDYPIFREVKHWIIGNICGNDIRTGEEIVSYNGPAPFKCSGPHRYVFLVYEQPGKLDFSAEPRPTIPAHYLNFQTRQFAAKYCIGEPIAGNYFVAEFENGNILSKILSFLKGKFH